MHAQIDYESFYAERGVTKIKDIWGQEYDVTPGSEPLMILTVSLYKGYKYFKKDGTYKDWERYWEWFRKTKSCFAIAKWNYSAERENLTTKCNYQILQNLDLEFDDFKHFADMSVDFYEKVTSDDIFHSTVRLECWPAHEHRGRPACTCYDTCYRLLASWFHRSLLLLSS